MAPRSVHLESPPCISRRLCHLDARSALRAPGRCPCSNRRVPHTAPVIILFDLSTLRRGTAPIEFSLPITPGAAPPAARLLDLARAGHHTPRSSLFLPRRLALRGRTDGHYLPSHGQRTISDICTPLHVWQPCKDTLGGWHRQACLVYPTTACLCPPPLPSSPLLSYPLLSFPLLSFPLGLSLFLVSCSNLLLPDVSTT